MLQQHVLCHITACINNGVAYAVILLHVGLQCYENL